MKAFHSGLHGAKKKIVWLDRFDRRRLYMKPDAVNGAMTVVFVHSSTENIR